MQADSPFPDRFVIRASLGVFLMNPISEGGYEGSANGFVCSITVSRKQQCFHYDAAMYSDDEKWAFAVTDIAGDFTGFDELALFIASWMDGVCSEVIEDYAKDALYLETSHGKLAFWGYNTHLDATPVIFVHGGPGGESNPVKARRLRLDHPVYLYDQMGCGMSDPIGDLHSWTAEDYAKELDEFITRMGWEKVILIGASWGAGLCGAYAKLTKCSGIEAMVLASPFLSSADWSEDALKNLASMGGDYLDRFRSLAESKDYGEEFQNILGEYNSRYLFNLPEHREWAFASAREVPNDVFKTLCGPNDLVTDGTFRDFDVTDFLGEIDVPVLYMCTDSDEITVERVMGYQHRTRGSRLAVIPYAGHVTALEQFDLYSDNIKAFLKNGIKS